MTEVEYVIANFAERFAAFQDKRVVLHGSRNYAEAIIDNFSDSFNFIGIMSLDPIKNEYFHGLKVLHDEDLSLLNIDIIILTERVKYEVEAFYSIWRFCQKNDILIYNMYGLNEFVVHQEANNIGSVDLEKVKTLCGLYDIVAFEVMDTVINYSRDRSTVSLRKFFYDLITVLRKQGKILKFSLRKSFSENMQIETLEKFGILIDEKKEIIRRHGEDLSFRRLREEAHDKKILYFGCGLANEFILPRYYGIDTYRFIGSYDTGLLIPLNNNDKEGREKKDFLILSFENIKKQILEKDLISFDIFDTLLIRKTLYPRDVFHLVENKAIRAGFDAQGFAVARQRAEEEQSCSDYNRIYNWLSYFFHWTNEITQKIKKIELDTEVEVLVPRTEVVDLLNFALKAGKHVVLTSDMYFSAEILRNILNGFNISGFEKILVSCDVKKSKHTGLYGELLRMCNDADKVLHIGDNPIADGIECKDLGINSVLVPSPLEMARSRGWEKNIQIASSLMERCLLGLIISKIFRNPFQNPDSEEKINNDRLKRIGISVIASLAVGHMTWLIQKLQNEEFAGVLFFARDGWVSLNIYKQIQDRFDLPPALYYYANRKSASLCCLDFPGEIDHLAEFGTLMGLSASDILKNLFQIPEQELLPGLGDKTGSNYIEKHLKRIHINADEARRGYLRYSAKCGLLEGNTYAVVDFITIGTVQKYLSRVLPFKLKGFLFGCHSPASLIKDGTEYYLQGNNPLLLEKYIQLEPFFCSPEPSQKSMEEHGEPVFDEEHRSVNELRHLKAVWSLAEAFAKEFFELFYQEGKIISPDLIEEIFATEEYYMQQGTLYDNWLGLPIM